ncbi:MAG: DM13 domain-containing protein [Actinomycetota bacterium]
MLDWIKEHKLVVGIGGAVGVAVVAYLAFAVFGVHTLFVDDKVDEANPFADAAATEPAATDDTTADDAATDDPASDGTPATTAPATPTIETLAEGQFIARDHPAEGTAVVITDGDRTFLRFEDDFATDNGPDLNVYLSTAPPDGDEGAFDDDFIDLGDLKGNIGAQNYEISSDIDLSRYQSVVVWCVRFSSAFGAAPLA